MEQWWMDQDGSPAQDFEVGDRKRVAGPTTKNWGGKCIVLRDVFSEHQGDRLGVISSAFASCPNTRFVVIATAVETMNDRLEEFMLLNREASKPTVKFPWPNVWFGTEVAEEEDHSDATDRIMSLLCAPTRRRFLIAPADFEIVEGLIIPKCKRCGGKGWYVVGNPFRVPQALTNVCMECPAREYTRQRSSEHYLKDNRILGGELDWVIFTPTNDLLEPDEARLEVLRKHDTDVTLAATLNPESVPLWRSGAEQ